MNIEDIIAKLDVIEERANSIKALKEEKRSAKELSEKRELTFYKGNFKMEGNKETRSIAQRFIEERASEGLKINSTGMDYYGSLVEKFRISKPLTSRASFLRGAYTGFQIPLITARPAVNASATEGDTNLTVDNQMSISKKTINPQLYYSILGITYQTDKFSMVTDAEIEDAFAESFGETIEYALQSRNAGASYPICGIMSADASVCASGNAVTAAAAGTVSWEDLYALADNAKGKIGKWTIVVPAGVMSKLLSTSTADYNFCKEEYIRQGTVRNIEVVEIATAADYAEGKVIATLIDLTKNLKVCVAADDVILREVYDKNSLNKYLQGAMGLAASVVLPNEVWQLVGKSAT